MNKENIKLIKIALLVISSIIVFVFGIKLLDGNAFKSSSYYYVRYDSAEGITLSTPILIKGVPVGTVSDISLDPENHDVIIEFSVHKELKISKGSIVLAQRNLLSSGTISVIFPQEESTINFYQEGDILPGKMEPRLSEMVNENMLLGGGALIKLAQGVLSNVNDVLGGDDLKKDLQLTFYNLAQLTGKINNITAQRQKEISQIIKNMEPLTKSLRVMSDQMSLFLEDLRLHPKRYLDFSLFGKKRKPYSPVETSSIETAD